MTPQVLAAKAGEAARPSDPARKHGARRRGQTVRHLSHEISRTATKPSPRTTARRSRFTSSRNYDAAMRRAAREHEEVRAEPDGAGQPVSARAHRSPPWPASAMQKATARRSQAADAQYDEAEKLLRDIIAKNQNLALINDAQFQVGELLLARGGFMSGDDNKQKQDETFAKALDAYRSVASKDRVVAAQKARIAFFADLRNKAGVAKDRATSQKYKRVVDKETEKLAQIEGRGDQTQTAKFKTGLIFFTAGQNGRDARALHSSRTDSALIEEPEDKKQALYFVTHELRGAERGGQGGGEIQRLSGGLQRRPDRAESPAHHGRDVSQPGVEGQGPEQGDRVFQRRPRSFIPKGKAFGTLVLAPAQARRSSSSNSTKREKALKETLAKNPSKELAVDAEFYLGTVFRCRRGKTAEAVATFKRRARQLSRHAAGRAVALSGRPAPLPARCESGHPRACSPSSPNFPKSTRRARGAHGPRQRAGRHRPERRRARHVQETRRPNFPRASPRPSPISSARRSSPASRNSTSASR